MTRQNDIAIFLYCCALLAMLLTAVSACNKNDNPAYSRFKSIENATLLRDRWYDFDTGADSLFKPTSQYYDVVLQVRHTTDFPHQILWIATERSDSSGSIKSDTVGIRLYSPDGRPTGKGRRGLYTTRYVISEKSIITPGYIISITHAMKEDKVPGITDVGIDILPSKK